MILSTPVLTAIKRTFPLAFAAMLVRPYTLPVIDGHPHLDQPLLDDPEKYRGLLGIWRLARMIRRYSFDFAILLHPTFRLAGVVWLAGISCRVGTAFRFYSFLFNCRVRQHRRKGRVHEADLNLQLAAAIGAEIRDIDLYFAVSSDANRKARELLHQRGVTPPFVVLHPGSGGSAHDWPPEKFAALADRIVREKGRKVVVTGSSADRQRVDRMIEAAETRVIRVDDELDLKALAAVLREAEVVVANSTGPLHLAVAVGTRVVGIYCPRPTCHPDRWGPYRRMDSVVLPPLDRYLNEYKDDCHGECMARISVDQVYEKIYKH
ncbi:glycosyltransferase family 9 protein [candidate division KSB1 bacterium]|nr:glycosyltransferase family 9 protein [candidate division KSB1 bacterium]